jgi:hypothetical protein
MRLFAKVQQKMMIKLMHHRFDLLIGYALKTVAFGKVLSDQTVGIFV